MSSPSPSVQSRRALQAAATQRQLLAAARSVFAEKGYQGATVGAITERARTAHGTFYLYFRNREDAFAKVMADVVDELYARSTVRWTSEHPYEAVRSSIRSFLGVFVEHKCLWRCLLEAMLTVPSVEAMWLDLRRRFVTRIAAGLEDLDRLGTVRALDTTMAANALGAMVEWFAFTHLVLGEPPVEDGSVDAAATVLADLWVHAVYGRLPVTGSSSLG